MTETIPETARLTADVVLVGQRDGELYVLLVRRGWDPFKGRWAVPGGHVDAGEETRAAARRELWEETGISVEEEELEPVGVYADPDRDPRGRYVDFAYTTCLADTPTPTASDDAIEARWVRAKAILRPGALLAFDHVRIVRDALRIVRGGQP